MAWRRPGPWVGQSLALGCAWAWGHKGPRRGASRPLPTSSQGNVGGGSAADATWSMQVALTPLEDE